MKSVLLEIGRVFGVIVGWPLQFLFFKRRTFYENENRPNLRKGGKLIIMNHFNLWDYVLTCFIVFPRKLNIVSSEHGFRNKFFAFGIQFFGGIRADREVKNMDFMKKCADVIRKGQLCQIFPEGRNTPDGEIHRFKQSYLVIAHWAKAPIVPIVTDGVYHPLKRTSVIIGEEIDISRFIDPSHAMPNREERNAANDYIYSKMLALQQELRLRKQKKSEE